MLSSWALSQVILKNVIYKYIAFRSTNFVMNDVISCKASSIFYFYNANFSSKLLFISLKNQFYSLFFHYEQKYLHYRRKVTGFANGCNKHFSYS